MGLIGKVPFDHLGKLCMDYIRLFIYAFVVIYFLDSIAYDVLELALSFKAVQSGVLGWQRVC